MKSSLKKAKEPAISEAVFFDMTTEFKNLWEQYSNKSLKYYQYCKMLDDVYIRHGVNKASFDSKAKNIISKNI